MPPKKRFITCEICGDRANRVDCEKRKFMAKFPLDESRCRQWVKLVGKEDLIYVPIEKLHSLKYVCGAHFDNKAFNKKKTRLKKSAVPSINLSADPLPDEMLLEFPCHISAQTDIPNVEVPQGNNKASTSQILEIAGPSHMEIYLPEQEMSRPKLTVIDIKLLQEHKRQHSDTSISENLVEHDYCIQREEVFQLCRKINTSDSGKSISADLVQHDNCTQEDDNCTQEDDNCTQEDDNCTQENDNCTQEGVLQQCKKIKTSDSGKSTSISAKLVEHDNCTHREEVLQLSKKIKTSDSDQEISPREKKLLKRIALYKRKINVLRKENVMPRIKSLALKTFIKAYIRNHGKKPQAKRWTSLDKALGIAIYKKSPRTYRYLLRLVELPSVRTLQPLLQSTELEPGISQTIMDHFKKKAAELNHKDKLCALLFDEMASKKNR